MSLPEGGHRPTSGVILRRFQVNYRFPALIAHVRFLVTPPLRPQPPRGAFSCERPTSPCPADAGTDDWPVIRKLRDAGKLSYADDEVRVGMHHHAFGSLRGRGSGSGAVR